MSRVWILILSIISFLGIGIIYSCSQKDQESDSYLQGQQGAAGTTFVGDQECQTCHWKEAEAWKGSHHHRAMDNATEESVLGDFSDVTFTHRGETYRFYRQGEKYMAEAPGPDGKQVDYEIAYTFGWEPLQQYLVDFGKGKFQALTVAWDTEKKQWFSLYSDEDIKPGDWLHWTGGAMNWNTMCADCHSTNLQQNYIVSADSFHTTWSGINVNCEACHGPGKSHVEFMNSEQAEQAAIDRIRQDLKMTGSTTQVEQVNLCARCHALREKLTGNYDHAGKFLDYFNPALPHPGSYFADGQIKEEVYVFGSFLQSKMYKNGISCTDCHNPHTLKLKANVTNNTLCLQCHQSQTYNTPRHHFHKINTEASQCISCHMPGRYYMQVDFRRDHSFRVPRPDLSRKFGTPNACNQCHNDKPAEWAARAIEKWYGKDRSYHFSETLAKAHETGSQAVPQLGELIADTSQPAIARAVAVWYLGQFPTQKGVDLLEKALEYDNRLIRNSAARALSVLPADMKKNALTEALDDSLLAVRLAAAGGLAEFSAADIPFGMKQRFNEAMQEYREYLNVNRYFPQGQMNRAQFFEKQGQLEKAINAYRKTLEKDPYFNPARINLAYLYNRQGKNAEAEDLLNTVIEQEPSYGPAYYSLALLLAEENRLKEAVSNFEKAADRMPGNARVRYNLAISYQTLNQPEEAESAYLQAIDLVPGNPDYRYGICTLYIQQEEYQKALPHARKLTKLQPDNPQIQNLLQMVKSRIRK